MILMRNQCSNLCNMPDKVLAGELVSQKLQLVNKVKWQNHSKSKGKGK